MRAECCLGRPSGAAASGVTAPPQGDSDHGRPDLRIRGDAHISAWVPRDEPLPLDRGLPDGLALALVARPRAPGEAHQAVNLEDVVPCQRPGPRGRIRWGPPSARSTELFLCDEASQYGVLEWWRFYQSVKEQPQRPFTVVFADFQQLQPLGDRSLCWPQGQRVQQVESTMRYRSTDRDLLLFLGRLRERQPTRQELERYFEGGDWRH